jgi:hypothetical protein
LVCFAALRHHYKTPVGAPACTAPCTRIHPEGYSKIRWATVVAQLAAARVDQSDVIKCVVADTGAFKA